MAYHLSPAVDSTMDGEWPPPTRRNFSAALEGPTSSLARRNSRPGLLDKSLFWNILGPFFFLSTITPKRRKGRATLYEGVSEVHSEESSGRWKGELRYQS